MVEKVAAFFTASLATAKTLAEEVATAEVDSMIDEVLHELV